MPSARLRRDPDLVVLWRSRELIVRNVRTRVSVKATAGVVALLDAFSRPRSLSALFRAGMREERVAQAIRELERAGLLIGAEKPAPTSRLAAWKGNVASALYHAATRDLRYRRNPAEAEAYLRRRFAEAGPPPPFRRYRAAKKVSFAPLRAAPAGMGLGAALAARRTTRDFTRQSVPLSALASIVHGTWGQTGWLDIGLGRLPTRTSPSGGSLHPIECYVLAWRVESLKPGIYHYDVRANELRRLRSGNFRSQAVSAASGQRWVGRSAFLCIMTAAFERTLWKYHGENAYRTVWLEAGHLAQTFALLATAHELGAYTTAAMQDSQIERLLGLDGVTEFPVYLCGAGVPASRTRGAPWSSLDPLRAGRT